MAQDKQQFREYIKENETVEYMYKNGDQGKAVETAVMGYCAENGIHGQGAHIINGFAPHVIDDIHGEETQPVWTCSKLGHTQEVVSEEQPMCRECMDGMEKVGEETF